MWGAYAFASRPTPVEPEAFKLVAALDLSLIVPALIVGGALLWRRRPWGYVIAAIASIQSALYLLVLAVNSLVAIHRGLVKAPGELPIWLPLTMFMTFSALVLLVNVRHERVGDAEQSVTAGDAAMLRTPATAPPAAGRRLRRLLSPAASRTRSR
jgi:hypothetical protein